ncbi:hypothetical protein F0562_025521 [Nyssa sinensis]|uniref:Uncharacterized protein n=1 Tax=Nyssa sinensis TaxID=561372 RepID=A0A5J5B817_9ASTE|nr:hypothetical protein F0562_025521 [Nyssa sinensis]
MCSDAGELRCRCWCNSAAVQQGYGSELRVGVVVEGRAASRAIVVAAIAPVTAGRPMQTANSSHWLLSKPVAGFGFLTAIEAAIVTAIGTAIAAPAVQLGTDLHG